MRACRVTLFHGVEANGLARSVRTRVRRRRRAVRLLCRGLRGSRTCSSDGCDRLFERFLRRDFLRAESHSLHQVRRRVRCLPRRLLSRLGINLALGPFPGVVCGSRLCLFRCGRATARPGLRACFLPRGCLSLLPAPSIELFHAPHRARRRQVSLIRWSRGGRRLVVSQRAMSQTDKQTDSGDDFHPFSSFQSGAVFAPTPRVWNAEDWDERTGKDRPPAFCFLCLIPFANRPLSRKNAKEVGLFQDFC
jgi:hypothetical protein